MLGCVRRTRRRLLIPTPGLPAHLDACGSATRCVFAKSAHELHPSASLDNGEQCEVL